MFNIDELKVYPILFALLSHFPNIKWGAGEAKESYEGARNPSSSHSSKCISDSSGSGFDKKLSWRLDFKVIFADHIKFNSLRILGMKDSTNTKISLLAKSFNSSKNMWEQFDGQQDHMYFKQRVSFQENPFKMSSENLNLKVKANKAYSQEPNFENP